jgi:hypothetical protein
MAMAMGKGGQRVIRDVGLEVLPGRSDEVQHGHVRRRPRAKLRNWKLRTIGCGRVKLGGMTTTQRAEPGRGIVVVPDLVSGH